MRIAFDHHAFCGQTYGGVSRYYARLAAELLRLQQDVAVFAPLYRNQYLRDLPSHAIRGRRLGAFPPFTTGLIRALSAPLVRYGMSKWPAELVHETYFSMSGTAPRACPTVLTVFDMTHERIPGAFPDGDQTTLRKRCSVHRADHVICISEHTRRDLIELFQIPDSKATVVHLGVDIRPAEPERELNSARDTARPYLLFVGNRQTYKNFDRFIQAVAGSTSLRRDFEVAAFGGGAFTGREHAMIHSLGLGGNSVKQIGGDDAGLSRLLAGAAALVYPSLYEGFGLPPLEAMAVGCPVVSSNASCLPEVIGDAAEFFDPTDPSDIAEAIERVVYSPARSVALIELGRMRVGSFTWERCARQTLDIYRRSLS